MKIEVVIVVFLVIIIAVLQQNSYLCKEAVFLKHNVISNFVSLHSRDSASVVK